MMHFLDALHSALLLFGTRAIDIEGIEISVNELDRLVKTAGGLAVHPCRHAGPRIGDHVRDREAPLDVSYSTKERQCQAPVAGHDDG